MVQFTRESNVKPLLQELTVRLLVHGETSRPRSCIFCYIVYSCNNMNNVYRRVPLASGYPEEGPARECLCLRRNPHRQSSHHHGCSLRQVVSLPYLCALRYTYSKHLKAHFFTKYRHSNAIQYNSGFSAIYFTMVVHPRAGWFIQYTSFVSNCKVKVVLKVLEYLYSFVKVKSNLKLNGLSMVLD